MINLLTELFIVDIKELSAAAGCATLVASVISLVAPYIELYAELKVTLLLSGFFGWMIYAYIYNKVKRDRKRDDKDS